MSVAARRCLSNPVGDHDHRDRGLDLQHGDQRVLRRLGDRRPRHVGGLHAAHLRPRVPRRRGHHLRAAPLPLYLVGGKPFPCANVDERDIRAVLEPDFDAASGSIEVCELAEHEALGYSSIVLAWRRRRIRLEAAS